MSQRSSFGTLEQLHYYEECIAKVSSEVAISRDECVALQERLCICDSELCQNVATIDRLIAEKQLLNQELREKVAIIEGLTSRPNQNEEQQAVTNANEDLAMRRTSDERYEMALLEKDGIIMALTTANEDRGSVILRLEATISNFESNQQAHCVVENAEQSQRSKILRLQESLQVSDSANKALQQALQEERQRTQLLKEDQKAHLAIQNVEQSQRSEILRLQDSLQVLDSANKALQQALQEERQRTQMLKEDQKAHVAIQDSGQSHDKREILRLQEKLSTSESDRDSLKFALQEERLLNQKFGKVEHLISSNSTISVASQSLVLAELEVEKRLSERLKVALEESTQINSRMLLANSAHQEKIEELHARVISCNARSLVPICFFL
jgi:hypothetical protein